MNPPRSAGVPGRTRTLVECRDPFPDDAQGLLGVFFPARHNEGISALPFRRYGAAGCPETTSTRGAWGKGDVQSNTLESLVFPHERYATRGRCHVAQGCAPRVAALVVNGFSVLVSVNVPGEGSIGQVGHLDRCGVHDVQVEFCEFARFDDKIPFGLRVSECCVGVRRRLSGLSAPGECEEAQGVTGLFQHGRMLPQTAESRPGGRGLKALTPVIVAGVSGSSEGIGLRSLPRSGSSRGPTTG